MVTLVLGIAMRRYSFIYILYRWIMLSGVFKFLKGGSVMPGSSVVINKSNIRDLPRPYYIKWLISEEKEVPGVPTKCYELRWKVDEAALDSWALHVRRHYIRDDELRKDCEMFDNTAKSYLQTFCIPTRYGSDRLGPITRSGDFAEIIISDMLQFIEGFIVPRYKQIGRTNPNISDSGSDVIGYKVADPSLPRFDDRLVVVEVKSKLTRPVDLADTIKKAAKDSKKDGVDDRFRVGLSLRAIAKKSRDVEDRITEAECRRFLRRAECPYILQRGSAAVVSLDELGDLSELPIDSLGLSENERLIIVHGSKLMDLVHSIFDRCIK